MNSRRFNQLKSRLNVIENTFLPAIKPNGNYTKKEQDQTRAYLLLNHAEIEAYFEEIAENKVKRAFKSWKLNKTKSNVLLSLVSFHETKIADHGMDVRVNKTLTSYIHGLRQNHGIKESNILSILLPIGIDIDEIDGTWLNTISSFGQNRGEIAHTSATVQQPLDPATIRTTIGQIMSEIADIDVKIKKLK